MNRLLKLLTQEDVIAPEKTVGDVYQGVSEKTGIDPEIIAQIGGVESSHGKKQDNKRSSATGIFQIMPDTARGVNPNIKKEHLKNYNVQEDVTAELLRNNIKRIKQLKGEDYEPTPEELYAFHNLGFGRGKDLLMADEQSRVEDVLPAKPIRNNPELYKGKRVGEALEAIKNKLNKRGIKAEINPPLKDENKEKIQLRQNFLDLFKE